MDQIRVNGIEEAERVLDEMIRNYPKQTVAAGLRAAAKPFVNRTKEAGPSPKFSKLAGVKVYTKGKEPLMAAGQFGGRTKRVWKTLSSYMSMYYISYWLNHGTLSNRSAAYHFKNARKPVSANWKGGELPLSAHNDHRIVMALSLLCSITGGSIYGAEAVNKSFPDYFRRLASLGIKVEDK